MSLAASTANVNKETNLEKRTLLLLAFLGVQITSLHAEEKIKNISGVFDF